LHVKHIATSTGRTFRKLRLRKGLDQVVATAVNTSSPLVRTLPRQAHNQSHLENPPRMDTEGKILERNKNVKRSEDNTATRTISAETSIRKKKDRGNFTKAGVQATDRRNTKLYLLNGPRRHTRGNTLCANGHDKDKGSAKTA